MAGLGEAPWGLSWRAAPAPQTDCWALILANPDLNFQIYQTGPLLIKPIMLHIPTSQTCQNSVLQNILSCCKTSSEASKAEKLRSECWLLLSAHSSVSSSPARSCRRRPSVAATTASTLLAALLTANHSCTASEPQSLTHNLINSLIGKLSTRINIRLFFQV